VGLPLLVAPIFLIPFLEGANVSFLQHLIEFLKVSYINFERLVLRLDEASRFDSPVSFDKSSGRRSSAYIPVI
jgi:hypothetical protein